MEKDWTWEALEPTHMNTTQPAPLLQLNHLVQPHLSRTLYVPGRVLGMAVPTPMATMPASVPRGEAGSDPPSRESNV